MKRLRTPNSVFSVSHVPVRLVALAAALVVAAAGCSKTTTTPAPKTDISPAPTAAHVDTYTTSFPSSEKVLLDGGRWISGKTIGVDWGYVSTIPGYATGTAGPKHFADSVTLLKGNWGPNQTAETVVRKVSVHGCPKYPYVCAPRCQRITAPDTRFPTRCGTRILISSLSGGTGLWRISHICSISREKSIG